MQNHIHISLFSCNLPPANDQDLVHVRYCGKLVEGGLSATKIRLLMFYCFKSQHRKFTMEKQILVPLLLGLEPT